MELLAWLSCRQGRCSKCACMRSRILQEMGKSWHCSELTCKLRTLLRRASISASSSAVWLSLADSSATRSRSSAISARCAMSACCICCSWLCCASWASASAAAYMHACTAALLWLVDLLKHAQAVLYLLHGAICRALSRRCSAGPDNHTILD